MPGNDRKGPGWGDGELDVIVGDYFAMLAAELAGKPYVKAEHRRRVEAGTGRSKGSVEFKLQNISAVLDELGMAWIAGYKPRHNYQDAIFAAIDRYLARDPAPLGHVPSELPATPWDLAPLFVAPPPPREPAEHAPRGLSDLVRKYDPAGRDHLNRLLGKAGEEFVLGVERRLLQEAGRPDLARKVRWVAAEDGDGAGYDILSFSPSGQERLVEVKTTNGPARTPFFLTRNEVEVSRERQDCWRLYRVHRFSQERRIYTVRPPLEDALRMGAEVWRASPA